MKDADQLEIEISACGGLSSTGRTSRAKCPKAIVKAFSSLKVFGD